MQRIVLALTVLLAMAATAPATAAGAGGELRLGRPRIAIAGEELLVSFVLEGAFDEALLARLRSGLATRFTYRFQLMRDRKRWLDAELDETTLEVVTMYNAVTHEYLVNTKRDGRLIESRLANDPAQLAALMTRFEALPLFSVARIPSGTRLLVRARAELGTRTLLSLIPVQLGTGWVESRKVVVPRRG